jgi:hypothetical protein
VFIWREKKFFTTATVKLKESAISCQDRASNRALKIAFKVAFGQLWT